jgi:uncharacterized phiE125 gp8 family phage protein
VATAATTLFGLTVVKNYLGVTDTTNDTLITQIADAVSARIESKTGRIFVTRTVTAEKHDGNGTMQLMLRKFPVGTVSALTVTSTPGGTAVSYTSGTDFDLDTFAGRIQMRNDPFFAGFQNVSVTYTAGFGAQDNAALPQDVYEAGLEYCKAVYDEKTTGTIAATSVSMGGTSFMLKPGMPWHITEALCKGGWVDVRVA